MKKVLLFLLAALEILGFVLFAKVAFEQDNTKLAVCAIIFAVFCAMVAVLVIIELKKTWHPDESRGCFIL